MNSVGALLDAWRVFFPSSPPGPAFCFLFQKGAQTTRKWLWSAIGVRSWVRMGELRRTWANGSGFASVGC